MGSQKQSHRVRQILRLNDRAFAIHREELGRKQFVINDLIEQNRKLAVRLAHYENRPPWWMFKARREWEENHD